MANEKRLIDVSKLVKPPYAEDDNITGSEMTYDEMDAYNLGIDAMWSRIQHYAPTVDAVEVVRCENCKHYDRWSDGRTINHCSKHDRLAYDDDFCSYGEKRESGTQPQREDV